jgi:hypothetical protein
MTATFLNTSKVKTLRIFSINDMDDQQTRSQLQIRHFYNSSTRIGPAQAGLAAINKAGTPAVSDRHIRYGPCRRSDWMAYFLAGAAAP